jgi:hypothetical protein
VSTKAVAVKQSLRDLLDGMPIVSTDKVQVTYGFPLRDPDRRWAVVGEIHWESTEWVTNRSRQEQFTVAVIFSVIMSAVKSEDVEQYAVSMGAAFDQSLRDNPSLNGLCVTTGFSPKALKSWPQDTTAYEAQFETEVRAVCRP